MVLVTILPWRYHRCKLSLTCFSVTQLGGFSTLMYYSGPLFGLVSFNKPTLLSFVVGATNFVFTLVDMLIIDKAGRRIILIFTVIGMVRFSPMKFQRSS